MERVLALKIHGPAERAFEYIIGAKSLSDALKSYQDRPKYQRYACARCVTASLILIRRQPIHPVRVRRGPRRRVLHHSVRKGCQFPALSGYVGGSKGRALSAHLPVQRAS
jgi:hypothetical protein